MIQVRQALVATSLGVSLLTSSVQTFAQTPSPAGTKTSDSATPGSETTPANEQAAALAYKRAVSAYGSKDLPGALQYMQESYGISGRAELLFNLASLERELKLCQDALRDYQSYLRRVPNGKFRSDAQRATQELQLECPAEPVSNAELLSSAPQLVATAELAAPPQRAAPLMPTPSEPPSDRAALPPVTPLVEQADQAPYWNAHRVVGWSAIASGVITGGVALYFMNAALRDHDEAAQIAASYKYAPKDPPWLDEQEAQHRDLRAARILGVTAGALVAGGAIVLSLSPKTHSSSRVSATLAVYPGHLGAACSGSF